MLREIPAPRSNGTTPFVSSVYDEALPPAMTTLLMVSVPFPEFLTVNVWVALSVPSFCSSKPRAVGSTESVGAMGAGPPSR